MQTGLYIEHVATGVWSSWVTTVGSSCPTCPAAPNRSWWFTNFNVLNSEPDHWYVKAGLRERWTSLGHTVAYGFYGQRNDMIGAGAVADDNRWQRITEWGLGAVQEIDAAAMSFWIQYDHFHNSVECDRWLRDDGSY